MAVSCAALLLTLAAPRAQALTGDDGLIAIGTVNGIEVFDPSGDGSDRHLLIPNTDGVLNKEPAWSPRGNMIAYERRSEIWVARADGTNAHRVSDPGESASGVAWAPDGRLSFLVGGGIALIEPDGTHRSVVVPSQVLDRPVGIGSIPTWTADGRMVVLLGGADLPTQPFIGDGDGSDLRALTFLDGSPTEYGSVSSNWQFSSTGLVAFVVYIAEDDAYSVAFVNYDGGRHLQGAGSGLGSRADVALSPSGNRAVLTGSHLIDGGIGVSIWDIDLDDPDPLTGTGGIDDVPGGVVGVDWQPRCGIIGTDQDDILYGTPGPDLICSLGGDDTIYGGGGNDVFYSGTGSDTVYGGTGNDVIVGGYGTDRLFGGTGIDLINSRNDNATSDHVNGGTGRDTCLPNRTDTTQSC